MPDHDHTEEPIGSSPLELYRRMRATQNRFADLVAEVTDIRREYQTLRRHPHALDVDDLGAPVDPVKTTDAVIHELGGVSEDLWRVADRFEATRAEHAIRLKLTDTAAKDAVRGAKRPPHARNR